MVDPQTFVVSKRLADVRSFVDRSFDRPIYLEEVAAVAGVETRYFSTLFRAKTGNCFFDWLASFRVAKAVELLIAEEDLAIWEVSQRVGMDERTFRRVFKKHTGVTARRYRSLHGRPRPLPSSASSYLLTADLPLSGDPYGVPTGPLDHALKRRHGDGG